MRTYFRPVMTIVAASLLFFTSCSDEKESTLNISDLKGRTKVEGVVTYNAGVSAVDNSTTINEPAANKTLYFSLELSTLQGSYQGTKVFTATTNSNGEYSIDLPAIASKTLTYKVSVESFRANRRVVNTGSGEPYISKEYFFTNTDVLTIYAKENIDQYKKISCDSQPTAIN